MAIHQLLVLQAIAFATQKHRFQLRKDGKTPYINHPIQVMLILAEEGQVEDSEILAAAVLHDTVEDTDTTFAEIESHFGARVRSLVAEVTDDGSLPEAKRKQAQIDHAPHLSPGATQIKIADKSSNVMDLYEAPATGWSLERRQKYLIWAETVISHCLPVNEPLEAFFQAIIAKGKTELGIRH